MSVPLLFAVMQGLLLGVVYFGNISVDSPGYFGLTFQHLTILSGVYVLLWLIGVVAAYKSKRMNVLLVQLVLVLTLPLAYAFSKAFAARANSYRAGLFDAQQRKSGGGANGLAALGLTQNMAYTKAKGILQQKGWSLDANDDESSPYEKFPEVACNEGKVVICSTGWRKGDASLTIRVTTKVEENPSELYIAGLL